MTFEQAEEALMLLKAIVGALGGISDAIRETKGLPPSSKSPSSRPRGGR